MINKLIIDNENKDTYNIIMKLSLKDGEYIIYTKDEINDFDDTICYVGKYAFTNGVQKIFPVENTNILENIDEVFRQVVMAINKKESGYSAKAEEK